MALSKIYTCMVDMTSIVPSKPAFLKKQVVLATSKDKHYNNHCIFCWEEYSLQHPAAKFVTCGHVFGRPCVFQMVEGPTGDLCPICRVKLFRRNLSAEVVVSTLVDMLESAAFAYKAVVVCMICLLDGLAAKLPYPHSFSQARLLVLRGPEYWATSFVQHCTDVVERNPGLVLRKTFAGTSLSDVLMTGLLFAPALCMVYLSLGFRIFKLCWFALEFGLSYGSQYFLREMVVLEFEHHADRMMVERIADFALGVKVAIVAAMFCSWGEPCVSLLGTAWNILATVAWR